MKKESKIVKKTETKKKITNKKKTQSKEVNKKTNTKKKKGKAFTLIELLAVIIILGILMIIAIPSVTRYISDSRKSAYVDTAREIISGARNFVNEGRVPMYDTSATYYLPSSCVTTENGGESPYGKFTQAYIGVTYDGKGYNYYWISVDEAGQGVKSITPVDKLDIDLIESDIKSSDIEEIVNTMGIDGRSKILILNGDCKNWSEEKNASFLLQSGGNIEDIDTTLYHALVKNSAMDNIQSEYVSSSTGINFKSISSNTNGKGLYMRSGTEGSLNPVVYYRGAVVDNNLYFAGFCWKIVRTTDTGGIKIIYNGYNSGTEQKPICNNTGTNSQLSVKKVFNSSSSSMAYVGYMYGKAYSYTSSTVKGWKLANSVTYSGGKYTLVNPYQVANTSNAWYNKVGQYTCGSSATSCSSVKYMFYINSNNVYYPYFIILTGGKTVEDAINDMFTNTYDSSVKTEVDSWFRDNLSSYTNKIEDTIWCNDRRINQKYGWNPGSNGMQYVYFSTYNRMNNGNPILSCSKNDAFTVNESEIGNGKLNYPVGLITSDEVVMAGGFESSSNNTYYLYTGQDYWTMSPLAQYTPVGSVSYANYIVRSSGSMSGYNNVFSQNLVDYSSYGIRPVISLKKGINILSGDGTPNNPYIVE